MAAEPIASDIRDFNAYPDASGHFGGNMDAVAIGLPEAPATGLTLENLRIEAAAGLRLGYAKDVVLRRVTVTAADGKPWILEPTIEGLQRVD